MSFIEDRVPSLEQPQINLAARISSKVDIGTHSMQRYSVKTLEQRSYSNSNNILQLTIQRRVKWDQMLTVGPLQSVIFT